LSLVAVIVGSWAIVITILLGTPGCAAAAGNWDAGPAEKPPFQGAELKIAAARGACAFFRKANAKRICLACWLLTA
jgi:hypothetical protein